MLRNKKLKDVVRVLIGRGKTIMERGVYEMKGEGNFDSVVNMLEEVFGRKIDMKEISPNMLNGEFEVGGVKVVIIGCNEYVVRIPYM